LTAISILERVFATEDAEAMKMAGPPELARALQKNKLNDSVLEFSSILNTLLRRHIAALTRAKSDFSRDELEPEGQQGFPCGYAI
jgi:hypothetical protein